MTNPPPIRVAFATGSRAEFGLLEPVMRAVETHPDLHLITLVMGSHLVAATGSPPTAADVAAAFRIDAQIPMQRPGELGRLADARALARGIEGVANAIDTLKPHVLLVLGDRIEALAAASAASVAGVILAHVHGGDRAEGVADEAMRHAITKLAHLHFPATEQSARRIESMGEPATTIHAVGSPAIDTLARIEPLDDETFESLGEPRALFLLHPTGRDDDAERADAAAILQSLATRLDQRVLAMAPNLDPGRRGIAAAIEAAAQQHNLPTRDHLPRATFIGLLKRLAAEDGLIVGNSSAALIEAAALRLPAIDVGPRQAGRERAANAVHADTPADLPRAIDAALAIDRASITHPYADGRAGLRIAQILAALDTADPGLVRKRCTY